MATVKEMFQNTEEFTQLLADAELEASGDWAERFVSDMRAKFEKWGDKMFVSENQLNKLRQIAEGDDRER